MSYIISIAPFINEIVENSYIKGMNTFCNIISDDLMMSQRLHSYSVWSLYESIFLNTEKDSFGMPKIQGVNALDFYSMMYVKRSSSSSCDIYLRVRLYCLVRFMGLLINCNVQGIMVSPRIHLDLIIFLFYWNTR